MTATGNAAPVIIKRKKVISGGGHHGGAWKVAYADFVTAMMAFFMLMWLLNATTENQRKGLADYFTPSIPISRVSGGGDNALNGDSVFSEDIMQQDGTGASNANPTELNAARGPSGLVASGKKDGDADLKKVEDALMGRSGESMVSEKLSRHIVTRVTDEGLVIELFSLPDSPLFEAEGDRPTLLMQDLAHMVAGVTALVTNDVAVVGHVRARPVVLAENPVWELSAARADQVRRLLGTGGLPEARLRRVTGHADRKPAVANRMALRNDRVEIVLLRY
jgi:chemotaxis protein MotB